ncbi:MAG: L-lactate permease [Rothia sp. (in: high G+C Gram-positive bacteria)]|uniref:L-lactate permease n=1 Tax=Rothia sp. (in: high G+C Gram-positive bacteria) TaxID=1885016 RepID=UPI0026E0E85A|nr:L-lactate permease [Rothia sp. (in: high G+C Gram-positive bacteria)]MDO5751023.1 L-lactate permease [Rothia sp. (in: high G+C Gram-positive bacteria)]
MWSQVYDPLNQPILSALVAAIPIIFFLLGLTVLKLSGLKSAIISLALAVVIGMMVFGMPGSVAAGGILYGFLSGAWPIGWIVLMAVWLYRLSVRAGNFYIVRASISSISTDQRVQMLLIAFAFGGFLEGAAGFGIPIAICAALLVSLGFNPLKASMLALIGNVASGAYGAIGIPVTNGAEKGGVALAHLSADMVPVLQIFALLTPVLMVAIQDGLRGLRETGLVALAAGAVYSGAQSLMLATMGSPELVDIIPPLLSLIALALIARVWQPKNIYREPTALSLEELEQQGSEHYSFKQVMAAWSPFYYLSIVILLWSTAMKPLFAVGGALSWTSITFPIPGVHLAVQQTAPIVANPTPVKAVYTWQILGASGTAILVAALITVLTANITWKQAGEELVGTWHQLKSPILMICLVMAVANVMNYGGMISAIALALAGAGTLFPAFSPIVGWIGVFVTGSVVNNNTLFAGLQATTAQQIGATPTLLVAANTAGGVMAKIVSPQSIAIAAAAVDSAGQEAKITSMSIRYSLGLLVLLCAWVYLLSLVGA